MKFSSCIICFFHGKKILIIHNFKAQCVNSREFELVYDTFLKLKFRIFLGLPVIIDSFFPPKFNDISRKQCAKRKLMLA